jgi:hypothetical protein
LRETLFCAILKTYFKGGRYNAIEYENDGAEADEEESKPRKEAQEKGGKELDPGLYSPCRQGMMPPSCMNEGKLV